MNKGGGLDNMLLYFKKAHSKRGISHYNGRCRIYKTNVLISQEGGKLSMHIYFTKEREVFRINGMNYLILLSTMLSLALSWI